MYLLGYDVGSSSVKGSLVEVATGKCVATDFFPKQEAPIKALKAGWAEQDPTDWWQRIKEVTRSILEISKVDPKDIAAIGISYQMHGLVMVDKEGNVLRDSIIWCDSRGVPYGEEAFESLGHNQCLEHLLNSPGNFTASKLQWVVDNEPDVFRKVYKIMLPGDYIAYKLTDKITTTVSGLSEAMLWDFKNNTPAKFLMDFFGYDPEILPEILPTFSIQGRVTEHAAKELGLNPGTPVTYRAGDQPNNALSLAVLEPGQIASTAGTSGVVYGVNGTTQYDMRSRVNNFAHVNHTAEEPRIGVLLCINGTGILNSWMKHNVADKEISYAEMNEIAAKAPVGCDGLSILPFGNGAERVLQNREIGCDIIGLNFNIHHREHLFRAAQEGIVFSFQYGIEIMEEMGLPVKTIHAGKANMFLSPIFRQTLAAVSGATIELYDTDGSIGAARGAGIGAGVYKDAKEAFATLKCLERITPPEDRTPYIEAYKLWKKRLDNEI